MILCSCACFRPLVRVPDKSLPHLQIIVFALSKRQCEDLAGHLATAELNSPDESELVQRIFWSAMDVLSAEDRCLPQIAAAVPMLQRGVGVHHSGLLPIVKEVIEVLFGEGLLKVRRSVWHCLIGTADRTARAYVLNM